MTLALIEPTDYILEIVPEQQATIWQQSRSRPTPWAQWNAYLNQLCLDTCLAWLKSEHFPTAKAATAPSLWNVINGSVVTVDNMRIALIPTEAIDRSELEVQQEWVDIPSFAPDYYLGVQIAIDCRSISVYGYTTHQQLKSQGSYDAQERTYCLDINELIPDLNALWLSYPHYTVSQTRASIAAIPSLDTLQADRLIERLSNPNEIMPRLAVPFQVWAALLDNHEWQLRLCQRHSGSTATPFTQLNRWLQGQFDEMWQSVDQVLLPQQMATAVRSNVNQNISSSNLADVYRVKVLEFNKGQIALLMGISPISNIEYQINESRISLQIYPAGGALSLPGETQLRLLSNGNEIGKADAIESEIIQLQLITKVGEQFEIEIVCCGQLLKEAFGV